MLHPDWENQRSHSSVMVSVLVHATFVRITFSSVKVLISVGVAVRSKEREMEMENGPA